ncbi:MAG: type IV pilin protein [Candidatus Berkiella sp.]
MMKKQNGFTFIELILTMVLSAILAGIVVEIIAGPIRAYFNYTQRSYLVDTAEASLEMIENDLNQSLPGSLNVKNQELEFREILYKGMALPMQDQKARFLTLNEPLPKTVIDEIDQRPLFIVFPSVSANKEQLYSFALVNAENAKQIKLNDHPGFLNKPMPIYIVTQLTRYECSQEQRTLQRLTQLSASSSEKNLIANEVSDCQFTRLANEPKGVLVSFRLGTEKNHIELKQPIYVGSP